MSAVEAVTTKTDLVEHVAQAADVSKAAAQRAVDAVTSKITEVLCADGSVIITGFGSFSVSDRKERKGRNPQTGAEITIKASKGVRFKVGKSLKDAVNS